MQFSGKNSSRGGRDLDQMATGKTYPTLDSAIHLGNTFQVPNISVFEKVHPVSLRITFSIEKFTLFQFFRLFNLNFSSVHVAYSFYNSIIQALSSQSIFTRNNFETNRHFLGF